MKPRDDRSHQFTPDIYLGTRVAVYLLDYFLSSVDQSIYEGLKSGLRLGGRFHDLVLGGSCSSGLSRKC